MLADGHLLLILHALPRADNVNRKARLFWRKPDGSWQSNEFGSGRAAIGRHLDEYEKRLEQLDELLDDRPQAEELFELIRELTPLRRATRNLHSALQSARETIPDDTDLIDARDRAGQLERTTELLYSDTKNSLDFSIALQAEIQNQHNLQMNVAAHRLNIIAAIFFPLITMTGVFGMNLITGFESNPNAFWIVILAGICAGLVATALFVPKAPKQRSMCVKKKT
jgi:Mg2+ and Co2+ transporter CorA